MKRLTARTQTLLTIGFVLASLILLNIVSIRLFGRLDVTRNRLFTLSEASRTIVGQLDDKVTVKAYFTEDLPSPYNNHRRLLLDQLNEYRAYARGNLAFEFVDPTGEKAEQDAQQQGIAPVQVQVVKEDKFEVKRAYMGLVIQYEDRREVIPVIQNPSTLEYEISSTIKRLTTKGQRKIGFLAGHGEPAMQELGRIQEMLRRQYELTTVDVSKGREVPADIAALIVMAPTSPIPEPEKLQIDQYLMRGGKVAFLLNRVEMTLQNRFGREVALGLDDLLEAYGLRIAPDAVRDVQCANISIMQQQYGFNIQSQVPFPYLPLASTFSQGNPMVKDLQGLVFFFVSSVDTVNLASRGLSGEILIRTSKQSGRLTGAFIYDPLQRYVTEDFPEQAIPLAALVQGKFRSAYAGKPVPVDTSAGSAPPPASPLSEGTESRVLLIGDGDFARDQYLGNRDNLTFFANMVDYLVDDAGLITIRSKEVSQPPLDQVSDGTKKAIKYANMILPPLLVIGYGLFRWRMRVARRKAMEGQ
jgi:gliding-associated putative ABC transporter substrate-binding component GldG